MLNKTLFGRLPYNPLAPLEDIIDSAVKTGADLSQVVLWNYANSWDILANKIPIPAILHERLSVDRRNKENRPPTPFESGSLAGQIGARGEGAYPGNTNKTGRTGGANPATASPA